MEEKIKKGEGVNGKGGVDKEVVKVSNTFVKCKRIVERGRRE